MAESSASAEVRRAVQSCLRRANEKFDAAIRDLQPQPVDPPLTVMELWGRASRQFHDAFQEVARQFARGYEHG